MISCIQGYKCRQKDESMTKTNYARGENPNSLANLKPGYGTKPRGFNSEEKKRRNLSVTETGWKGTQLTAREYGCKSVSEFLEKLGRGEIDLSKKELDLSA